MFNPHVQREQSIVRRDDGSYLVDGLLPFIDLQQQIDLAALTVEAHLRDFETIAGFVLALFGRIPLVSERVDWLGYRFEVVDYGWAADRQGADLAPAQISASQATHAQERPRRAASRMVWL